MPAAAGGGALIERTGQFSDSGNRAVYTYANAPLGLEAPTRQFLIAFWAGGVISTGIAGGLSCTVAGQVCSVLTGYSEVSSAYGVFLSPIIPTGLTTNIVCTGKTGGSFNSGAIHVFRVDNLKSQDPIYALEQLNPTNANRLSTSISPPKGGFILGVAGSGVQTGNMLRSGLPDFGDKIQTAIQSSALLTGYVRRADEWEEGDNQVWLNGSAALDVGALIAMR